MSLVKQVLVPYVVGFTFVAYALPSDKYQRIAF